MQVAPGIYPRGTVDYDAIDAVNLSALKELAVSPKRYQHRRLHPKKQTPSMFRGSSAHTAILEPDRFHSDYVNWTGKQRRGKKWDAFRAQNAGKEIIRLDEYALAVAMRDAVRGEPLAARYLSDGRAEVALVWVDRETGVTCKGRVDWLNDAMHAIPDLKGCKSVVSRSFWQTGGRLLYHAQAALYADAYQTITGIAPISKVIAVEFEPPHDVVVYNLPEEFLAAGRAEYHRLLVKLVECERDGRWLGYANGCEVDAQLPAYLMPDESNLEGLGLELDEAS